jgi:hypothetical protein
MLMIVALRWALNTRPFTRDFNDRQDVRRAATQSHPFSASHFHPAQIQRRGLKVRLPSFRWCCRAPTPPCRTSVQLVRAYEQTAPRCFGKDRSVMSFDMQQ